MRPRVKDDAPPMTDTIGAILLGGWCAEPPGGASHGFGGGFLELAMFSQAEFVAFWRLHETYLRQNAQRLAIEPEWDGGAAGLVFFGEYLAFELAQRNARG